eukprot:1162002-Pelagomonas_calceolata.AAC.7
MSRGDGHKLVAPRCGRRPRPSSACAHQNLGAMHLPRQGWDQGVPMQATRTEEPYVDQNFAYKWTLRTTGS